MLEFIYQEGYDDYFFGYTVEDNPYDWESEEYYAWKRGFLDACWDN